MRRLLLVLCCLVLSSVLWAQEIPKLGLLSGSVKFDDGTPVSNQPVIVSVEAAPHPAAYTFPTNAKGEFSGVVLLGKATITCMNASKEVTVTDNNDGVRAEIVLEMKGVFLEIAGVGNARALNISASFTTPDRAQDTAALQLSPTRYWYPTVPPTATEFVVQVMHPLGPFTRRWPLDAKAKSSHFVLALPSPVEVKITVMDENGKPMPNANLQSNVDTLNPDGTIRNKRNYFFQTSDAGVGSLSLPSGSYTVRLRNGDLLGVPLTVKVPDDQPTFSVEYTLSAGKPRKVTQTIFTVENAPAAGARVSCCYIWKGRIEVRTATADAAGKVVWEALPPTPATVWGAGIPLGQMKGDETEISKPLPTIPMDNNRTQFNLSVKCTNVPADATRLSAITTISDRRRSDQTYSGDVKTGEITVWGNLPQSHLALFVLADGTPPRFATLDLYLPDVDQQMQMQMGNMGRNTPTLDLALSDGALLTCGFTSEDGAPIAALNRLGVQVEKTDRPLPGLASEQTMRAAGMLTPLPDGAGHYRIALPGAGTYRLLVDLFDGAAPAPPQLRVAVKEGANEATIKLPAPLATVPGGTTFSWYTPTAPAEPRSLTTAATGDQIPIFGPREALLYAWYRPAPNRLVMLRKDATGLVQQELHLRAMSLKTDGNGANLHPLFPSRYNNYNPGSDRPNATEVQGAPVQSREMEANLWTTTYLVTHNMNGACQPLTVPPTGPTALTIPTPVDPGPYMRNTTDQPVEFVFPPFEKPKARNQPPPPILYTIDGQQMGRIDYYQPADAPIHLNLSIPRNAARITFYSPGTGVISDIAIPAFDPANGQMRTVTLPGWQDGAEVSGTLLHANGTPWAKQTLMFQFPTDTRHGYQDDTRIDTDDAGKFTVKGAPPGVVSISPTPANRMYNGDPFAGWALLVPKTGLKDVTLRQSNTPFVAEFLGQQWGVNAAWWLPDTGAPEPLPVSRNTGMISSYRTPVGPGRIWLSASDGSGGLERSAQPGSAQIILTLGGQNRAFPCALGLYLPLDQPLPQGVSLIGQGAFAGITVDYSNVAWHPVALLKSYVAQIDAVPAGKWLVRLTSMHGTSEQSVEVGENGAELHIKP